MSVAQIYWEVIPNQLIITTTEKVGYTSIAKAVKRSPRIPEAEIPSHPARVRLYLRHPIERLRSAWSFFTDSNYFPDPDGDPTGARMPAMPFERFIDQVLDEGYSNVHWAPQLAQHKHYDEIYRFENIDDTWPHGHAYRELGHWNKSKTPKPAITYRHLDLVDYYLEDLDAWLTNTK